jgi:hypothetical protein
MIYRTKQETRVNPAQKTRQNVVNSRNVIRNGGEYDCGTLKNLRVKNHILDILVLERLKNIGLLLYQCNFQEFIVNMFLMKQEEKNDV